jgi:hypothetical protein
MGTELITSKWSIAKKPIFLKAHKIIKPLQIMHMKPQIIANNIQKQVWQDQLDFRKTLTKENKEILAKQMPKLEAKRLAKSRVVN